MGLINTLSTSPLERSSAIEISVTAICNEFVRVCVCALVRVCTFVNVCSLLRRLYASQHEDEKRKMDGEREVGGEKRRPRNWVDALIDSRISCACWKETGDGENHIYDGRKIDCRAWYLVVSAYRHRRTVATPPKHRTNIFHLPKIVIRLKWN